MNANQYQELARRTAALTSPVPEEFHWALGVMGEYHEISQVYRDAVIFELHQAQVALADEIGDMLWYLSQLATAYEIPFDDCVFEAESHPPIDIGKEYLLYLSVMISELMERIKKLSFYQKAYDPIGPSDIKRIVNVLALMIRFTRVRTLEGCMAANIAKLQARYPEKFNG
jgi:NTP pyrophosphatase (non-canonical NTP hydrolase)